MCRDKWDVWAWGTGPPLKSTALTLRSRGSEGQDGEEMKFSGGNNRVTKARNEPEKVWDAGADKDLESAHTCTG